MIPWLLPCEFESFHNHRSWYDSNGFQLFRFPFTHKHKHAWDCYSKCNLHVALIHFILYSRHLQLVSNCQIATCLHVKLTLQCATCNGFWFIFSPINSKKTPQLSDIFQTVQNSQRAVLLHCIGLLATFLCTDTLRIQWLVVSIQLVQIIMQINVEKCKWWLILIGSQ